MKATRIIGGKDSAIAILLDETYVTNHPEISGVTVWRGDIETHDGSSVECWNWSVTYVSSLGVPMRIGSSLDEKNSPLHKGMFPADSVQALDNLLGFLCNTAEQPENSDTFSEEVSEWAVRWSDLLEEASIEALAMLIV